ncbi:MAG: energy transducer TonB [Bacteroidales bacterium]|nr:energy transducer TonB [Bacteroidales bacterium]
MEIKKTEKASLENKRLIFAEVGLIAALLAVLAGFESSTRAKEVALLQGNTQIDNEDDILAIPLDTPPPAPQAPALPMLSDELEIVEDDVTVDLDFQSLDDTDIPVDIQEYVRQEVVEEDVEEETLPFVTVEQKPTFNGGDANDFAKWVNSRLVYPEIAKDNGVEGRVVLQFTIGKDGRLQDVKVLNSPDESLAREAIRVVSSSPKWEPGRQRDRAVKVSYTFPVIYRLR